MQTIWAHTDLANSRSESKITTLHGLAVKVQLHQVHVVVKLKELSPNNCIPAKFKSSQTMAFPEYPAWWMVRVTRKTTTIGHL